MEARDIFKQLLTDDPTTVWRSEAALLLGQLAFSAAEWGKAVTYARQAQKAALITDTVKQEADLRHILKF